MDPTFADLLGIDTPILILVVLVVLFGGAAIPKLARSLGSAQHQFKKGMAEGQVEGEDAAAGPPTASATPVDSTPAAAPLPSAGSSTGSDAKLEAARQEVARLEAEQRNRG